MQHHTGKIIRSVHPDVHIRTFDAGRDSVLQLTSLLNRSYKQLADIGFRFVASHQDSDRTLERIQNATCFIGTIGEQIVATISYYNPQSTNYPGWPEGASVAHFGQFAVEPSLQSKGLGTYLLEHVEQYAREQKIEELALDTAENASHLVNYYSSKGYRFITHVQWEETNYRSVIMSKKLSAH
jgi:GNAT superfamily N-acetyltransferase